LHGEDGQKLSKRHGALGIHEYKNLGYLPETMRNYLLRLGWSHGDDEIISTEQAIAWFNLDSIGQSPSRVDYKKLDNLNGHYMRQASDVGLADGTMELLKSKGVPVPGDLHAKLVAAMPGLKERAKTLVELADGAYFLTAKRPLELDDKANKLLTPEARAVLKGVSKALEATDWSAGALDAATRAYAEQNGHKLGTVAQPLRAALTGRSTSPGIFDVLVVLGRAESLGRIADQAQG
jgi:glutamyl-tRNA synthetase